MAAIARLLQGAGASCGAHDLGEPLDQLPATWQEPQAYSCAYKYERDGGVHLHHGGSLRAQRVERFPYCRVFDICSHAMV